MKFSAIVCANPVALLRIPLPGEKLGIVDISRCRHWSAPFFVLEDDFFVTGRVSDESVQNSVYSVLES